MLIAQKVFKEIGFSKNEAKIYEALVEIGETSISTISSTGKVNRRNVYDSIKNLLTKNLVTRASGMHGYRYKAANPNRLRDILSSQAKQVNAILPELTKLYKVKPPSEQIFISRGKEGIKNFWRYAISQDTGRNSKATTQIFAGSGLAWQRR